ncbi:hypothetical protein FOXB_17158, partial [Fusarium oxysporum f. sp. conglutinans Fo5176]
GRNIILDYKGKEITREINYLKEYNISIIKIK